MSAPVAHGGAGRRATVAPPRAVRAVHSPPDARARILDAAESLFAAHGFDGTSTAHIARSAEVPKGLLFYYFPAKSDILTSLLDERLGEMAIDPAPLVVAGDPVSALVNIGQRVLRLHAESGVLREIIWHEAHLRAEVRTALVRYRHGLHDAIEAVLVRSLARAADARMLHTAATAWEAVVTARPLEGRTSAALHAPESLRQIAELLCRGLVDDAAG